MKTKNRVQKTIKPAAKKNVKKPRGDTKLGRKAAEIQALLEASRSILKFEDFSATSRTIFDSCRKLLGATSGYVALLSENGGENEVQFLESGGLRCTVDPSLPMPIRGLRSICYKTGKAVYENDFMKSKWVRFMPEGHVILKNVLFAPLTIEGKTVGLLGLGNKRGKFTDKDAALASAFGELAAIALYNSRLIEDLRASEKRYRSVVETAEDAIVSVDGTGRIIYWNRGAERIFGYGGVEALGKPLAFIMPERYRKGHAEGVSRVAGGGDSGVIGRTVELSAVRKDGSEFPVELSLAKWESGEGTFFTGIIRDITSRKAAETELKAHRDRLEIMVADRTANLTAINEELETEIVERRQAERLLRESEEKFRGIMEAAPIGLAITSFDGRVLEVNPALYKMLGYAKEEFLGIPAISHYVNVEDRNRLIEQVRKGGAKDLELQLRRKDGTTLWGLVTSLPHAGGGSETLITAVIDITERKLIEEHLLHSQKMQAIGHLAGGVAHDFNNRLAAIMNYGFLLRMKMPENDPLRATVEQILSISEKTASLTHSLLAFSRKQIISPKPVGLNDIVRSVESMLIRLLGKDIKLKTELAERDVLIMADAGSMENVLINLATNSRDAMPKGGLLMIETDVVTLDETYFTSHDFGKAGKYALISVSDTGVGMDKKLRDRIFEPFFTTKDIGKGTGLGLSVAHGVISQHGGSIEVYSEPGKGTTFKIYLPAIEAGTLSKAESQPALGGSETVLLAEDDPDVRRPMVDILTESGYRVIEAVDGEDAIAAFIKNRDSISLLIFDVTLPKKNGRETFSDILELKPGMKVLFTSGYTENIIHKNGVLEEGLNFISKPAPPSEFLRKVRKIIDD